MLTDHVQLCNSNRLSIAMYLICGINFISVTCLLLGVAIFINSSVLLFNMLFHIHPRPIDSILFLMVLNIYRLD